MDLLGGTFSLLLSNLAQMPSSPRVERGQVCFLGLYYKGKTKVTLGKLS